MEKSGYLEKSKKYKGFHYSVLDDESIKYLHSRTLEMFKQVRRIFDENKIRYIVCGGTLLGAFGGGSRIGKFIPWDDDLDICIFEEDYKRAAECLNDRLKDGAMVQWITTDPNYYLGWMKVRDQHSHVYPDAPRFQENGVWIDIYKLVKTKEKKVSYLSIKETFDYLKRRMEAGGMTREEYENRIREERLEEKLTYAKQEERKSSNNKEVYIIWSASKIVVEEEWIEPLSTVCFEGLEVTTFRKPEEYLIRHYGETYNELPSDEMRRIGINKIIVR